MAKRSDLEETPLSPEELAALIHEDFATFVQVMYRATKSRDGLVWSPYLDLLCSRLQDVANGKRRRLIVTIPPRHLKSFCVSVALPAFLLGRDSGRHVMTVSYGQDLAKEFARDCLSIMQCEEYRSVFGEVLAGHRQPLHAIRTRAGGVRRATSLDGTATGVGADLIVFDDPQKPGETLSDAMRKSTNEMFENTFLSRANDPESASIIIVMQRLHEDDFVGHVQGRGGDWEVINLPAVAEEDQAIPFETFLGPQIYRRAAGEVLHPGRISKSTFDNIRQAMGEALWATQYQQRPTPAGGEYVQAAWFQRYTTDDLPDDFHYVLQSWDTASTVEEWSDFCVCTTWGVIDRHAYLLDVHRRRYKYPDLKRAVVDQMRLYGATRVLVEDKASGTQIIQDLRAEGFGIEGVKPVYDKKTRMISQTAKIEGRFVHVPAEAPWVAEYLHEMVVFPNGRFDDQVDSTSQALAAIYTWSNGGGLYEFYRQEAEAQKTRDEAIWVLDPPVGMGLLFDIKGKEHRPDAQGLFHLKRREAMSVINKPGWKIIRAP